MNALRYRSYETAIPGDINLHEEYLTEIADDIVRKRRAARARMMRVAEERHGGIGTHRFTETFGHRVLWYNDLRGSTHTVIERIEP